jgi:hypothetical protein
MPATLDKNLSNFYLPFENSTTCIAIFAVYKLTDSQSSTPSMQDAIALVNLTPHSSTLYKGQPPVSNDGAGKQSHFEFFSKILFT